LRGRGGKSNSLEAGSLVHVILEHYSKSVISGKNRNDAISIGYEAGKEYITGYTPINKYVTDPTEEGLKNTPSVGDRYIVGTEHVFKTMEEYFDHYRSDSFTIIAAEETRRELIYEDEFMRIIWAAKFDQIVDMPNGFMSVDHKTMKQKRISLSLNNQFMGQCVLLKARNVLINKIGFQTSLKPHEKFERVVISYSPDRLAEFTNEIVPHYARMMLAYHEAEYFPPNFTHCENKYGTCEFREIEEMDRNMREEALNLYFKEGKKWEI
jgi:hypothetical protein